MLNVVRVNGKEITIKAVMEHYEAYYSHSNKFIVSGDSVDEIKRDLPKFVI